MDAPPVGQDQAMAATSSATSADGASRTALRAGARAGLIARATFYLLLAYLTVRIAALSGGGSKQVDANGALRTVAAAPLDKAVLAVAGVGFALFGVVRLRAAWTDKDESTLGRVTTVIQGLGSFVVAYIPFTFVFGDTSTGSEQQTHKTTSHLLGLPGGRVIVVVVGLVVLGWAAWQIRGAVRRDHEEGLDLAGCGRRTQRVIKIVSGTGLVARALVMAPIGIFFIVAGFTFDANKVHGLDGELLLLAHHGWGTAVLALIALALLDFAAYALVEARFRRLDDAS